MKYSRRKVGVINKSNYDLPKYAKEGDSGMDVHANIKEPITLKPLERALIPTGLSVDIPSEDLEIQVRSRSGEALKKGLVVLNTPGTIDSSYTGEIGVIIINLSPEEVVIEPGERVAQLVLCGVEHIEWEPKEFIEKVTDRGATGYGSSGNK